MRERLLSKIYALAMEGDIKAARVFIEASSEVQPQPTTANIKNQQNNFIQINGTTVTQEQLEKLPSDLQNRVIEALKLVQVSEAGVT